MRASTETNSSVNVGYLHAKKLNIKEAADALCMSRTTFNKHRENGDLPQSISIAGREYWLESDLEKWIVDQNPHLAVREALRQQAANAVKKQQTLKVVGR